MQFTVRPQNRVRQTVRLWLARVPLPIGVRSVRSGQAHHTVEQMPELAGHVPAGQFNLSHPQ